MPSLVDCCYSTAIIVGAATCVLLHVSVLLVLHQHWYSGINVTATANASDLLF